MRPRRSSASTWNGKIVSSAEVAAGARAGISMRGSDMMAGYIYIYMYGVTGKKSASPVGFRQQTSARRRHLSCVQAPGQNAFLGVQAVLGLVEHDRLRPSEHLLPRLVSAMGGQAVHEHRTPGRPRPQPGGDPIALD